jgi:hypothetical protein
VKRRVLSPQFYVSLSVIVHARYDDRGNFNLTHLGKELRTAREFVAYVIADKKVSLRFHFTGNVSVSSVRLTVGALFLPDWSFNHKENSCGFLLIVI